MQSQQPSLHSLWRHRWYQNDVTASTPPIAVNEIEKMASGSAMAFGFPFG
jgi:hypothetical protein